ncbi:hypothetical protein pb186bvf_017767 [Paramecium bursaria]
MGSAINRNRHWWYRSLYDDYIGREMRISFGISALLWIPHYAYGIYVNRRVEEGTSRKIYSQEWGPRRNRLTHSLVFEQFEQVIDDWQKLNQEYAQKGQAMLEQ